MPPHLGLCLTTVPCLVLPITSRRCCRHGAGHACQAKSDRQTPLGLGAARIDWNCQSPPFTYCLADCPPWRATQLCAPPPPYGTLAAGSATAVPPLPACGTLATTMSDSNSPPSYDGSSTRCLNAQHLRHRRMLPIMLNTSSSLSYHHSAKAAAGPSCSVAALPLCTT